MYEVVCPDGLVRHSSFAVAEHAEGYTRFANRHGDGVEDGKPACEPNLPDVSPCVVPSPQGWSAHWTRDMETGQPLLNACPVCDSRMTMPESPTYDLRGPAANGQMRKVVVDVRCAACPAAVTYFVDTGHLCCFRPNQPLRVRNVPRSP